MNEAPRRHETPPPEIDARPPPRSILCRSSRHAGQAVVVLYAPCVTGRPASPSWAAVAIFLAFMAIRRRPSRRVPERRGMSCWYQASAYGEPHGTISQYDCSGGCELVWHFLVRFLSVCTMKRYMLRHAVKAT
jgi:hypothetical protein